MSAPRSPLSLGKNPHITKQGVLKEVEVWKPRALDGRRRQASLKVIERALSKANAGEVFVPTGSGTKVRRSKQTNRMVERTKDLWLNHRTTKEGSYRGLAEKLKEEGIVVKKDVVGAVVRKVKAETRTQYLQYPVVQCPPLPGVDRVTVLVSRPPKPVFGPLPKPEGFEPAPPAPPAAPLCLTYYGFGLCVTDRPGWYDELIARLRAEEARKVAEREAAIALARASGAIPMKWYGYGLPELPDNCSTYSLLLKCQADRRAYKEAESKRKVEAAKGAWRWRWGSKPVAAKTTTRGPRCKTRPSQFKQDKNDLQQIDQAITMLASDTSDNESTATKKRPLSKKAPAAEPAPKKRRTNPRRRARATKKFDFEGQC